MTRKEIEVKLNEVIRHQADCERLIASLKNALLEHNEDIPDSPTFTQDQEKVFFMDSDLHKNIYLYQTDPKPGELVFNSFHTAEEVDEFCDMCRWNAMLLHCRHYLCPDYKPDWDTDNQKYAIYLNAGRGKPRFEVDFGGHQFFNYNCVSFSSVDLAQKAADWMNKHWGYGVYDGGNDEEERK